MNNIISSMTNTETLEYVSQRIKRIRLEKNISQTELAAAAEMSQPFLANVENGKKEPSTMTLIRLAKALDISPREFFPETESNEKNKIKEEIIQLLNGL